MTATLETPTARSWTGSRRPSRTVTRGRNRPALTVPMVAGRCRVNGSDVKGHRIIDGAGPAAGGIVTDVHAETPTQVLVTVTTGYGYTRGWWDRELLTQDAA